MLPKSPTSPQTHAMSSAPIGWRSSPCRQRRQLPALRCKAAGHWHGFDGLGRSCHGGSWRTWLVLDCFSWPLIMGGRNEKNGGLIWQTIGKSRWFVVGITKLCLILRTLSYAACHTHKFQSLCSTGLSLGPRRQKIRKDLENKALSGTAPELQGYHECPWFWLVETIEIYWNQDKNVPCGVVLVDFRDALCNDELPWWVVSTPMIHKSLSPSVCQLLCPCRFTCA